MVLMQDRPKTICVRILGPESGTSKERSTWWLSQRLFSKYYFLGLPLRIPNLTSILPTCSPQMPLDFNSSTSNSYLLL